MCNGMCAPGYLDCNGNKKLDGCETYVAQDRNNCGLCGKTCTSAQACINGACVAPAPCQSGTDIGTGAPWVVCGADAASAWVSMSSGSGGMFHALLICNQLGYSKVGKWDGTTSSICGLGGQASSCTAPGSRAFTRDWTAFNCGTDALGQMICNTVAWDCLK